MMAGSGPRLGLLVAACAVVACEEIAEPVPSIVRTQRDSADVAIVEITGPVADLPEWGLASGPVTEIRGDAPPHLASVGEIELLSDGRLLVEDNQSDDLRLFDADGTAVRLLGGRGDGPGEFQNVTELSVTLGDTAYAYDRRLYRVSVFSPDGDLVRTIPLGRARVGPGSLTLDASPISSGLLIAHSMGGAEFDGSEPEAFRDQRDAVLHVIDGSGVEQVPPLRFAGGYSIRGVHGDARAVWANEPFVSTSPGRVLHGSAIEYELILSTPDLRPTRIVRWAGWPRPLGEATVAEVRDGFETGLEELRARSPDLADQLLSALFDPILLPDSVPAIATAFLDIEGRIWVSRFPPTGDRRLQEDAWHVLTPDGEPLARLRLPPRTRLAAVRGISPWWSRPTCWTSSMWACIAWSRVAARRRSGVTCRRRALPIGRSGRRLAP